MSSQANGISPYPQRLDIPVNANRVKPSSFSKATVPLSRDQYLCPSVFPLTFGRGGVVIYLPTNGNTFASGKWLATILLSLRGLNVISARLPLQEAALLDGTTGLDSRDAAVVRVLGEASILRLRGRASPRSGTGRGGRVARVDVANGRGQMGDVLSHRVLRAYSTGVDAIALAGLGHGVVAGVEVLAVLEVLGEVIGARGELAVKTEEALLLRGEGLDVDLVLLMRIHRRDRFRTRLLVYRCVCDAS